VYKRQGYEVSEVYEELDEEGKKYFFFDGCKACMIESNVIFEETRIMTEIVLSYNEIYDGWGTNIVK
jgi:regulator of RNase E activity RraB